MDLVNELRKLEGVNTSFDYGVEIIVMVVKETTGNYDDLKTIILQTETKFANLFDFDHVCRNGFNVAKNWIWDYISFHNQYLNFIKELKFLEYFGTNYRILDGNLKPLLTLQEANISSHYRNYNLRDKDLPHITVYITEGNCGHRVRLDTLELGKEDPRITWLW
jgi:hypothetical protein